jgi:YcaO-like protein with predicted kinase domain
MALVPTAQMRALQQRLGITRLAIQTGLDQIGLPVVAAIRPLSRSICVSFGKGLTLQDAAQSALMEAAELFFAEQIGGSGAIHGYHLATGTRSQIEAREIAMDYTLPPLMASGSATGLAAHWQRDEAILHGLLEVIERDAHQSWNESDDREKAGTLIGLHSVSEAASIALLKQVEEAGLRTLAWMLLENSIVCCVLVEIIDPRPAAQAPYAQGAAAHPDPQLAFRKALMEAIQVRLTYIAGSRDDLDFHDYGERYQPMVASRSEVLARLVPRRHLASAVTPLKTGSEQVKRLVAWLDEAKVSEAAVYDLAPPDAGIHVVKTVVPALRDAADADDHHARRHREMAAAE